MLPTARPRGPNRSMPMLLVCSALGLACQPAVVSAKVVITQLAYASHGPAVRAFLDARAKDYMKKNPNIQIRFVSGGGSMTEYLQKLVVMVVGGKAPDVTEMYPGQAAPLVVNKQLINLKPYVVADPELKPAKYSAAALAGFTWEGVQWGLPTTGGTIGTLYNKTLYAEAGLTDPNRKQDAGQWTWETFLDDAKKLTVDKNGDGKPEQYGVHAWVDLFRFAIWVHQAGGLLFNRVNEPSQSTWSTPAAKKGIEFYTSWWTKYGVVGGDFLAKDNVGLAPQAGPWDVGNLAKAFKGKLKYDVAPMPRGPANDGSLAFFNGFQITAGSKRRKEAWDWIRYLGDPAMQAPWVEATGRTPVFRALAEDYASMAPLAPEHVELFMTQSDNPATVSAYDSSVKDFRETAATVINKVIAKTWSVDQALANADRQYTVMLKRIKK